MYHYLSSLAQSAASETSKVHHRQIHQALGQLPDLQRTVVELRCGIHSRAYSFVEIARLLDTSPSVVSRRHYGALERLRGVVTVEER